MTAAARSPLFYRSTPGGTPAIIDVGRYPGGIFYADSTNSNAGDTTGHGLEPDAPFLTINYAATQCTASKGDVIIAMPGHVETVTAAAGLAFAVAGVKVICQGEGSSKATINFTTATSADMDIDAAGITLENPRFTAGIDGLLGPIDVNAADFKIIGGEWYDGTTIQTVDCVIADANADRMVIDGWTFHEGTAGTQKQSHIQVAGATNVVLKGIRVTGDFATGIIENGTAWVNATLADCLLENTNATPKPGLLLQAGSSGNARNVHITIASGSTPVTATSAMQYFDCQYSAADGSGGDEIGTVLSGSVEDKIDTATTRIGTPANTGGTATIAAILGDPSNTSIAARLATIEANQAGTAGIVTWAAAAAPANGVSLSEALRYVVETQLGALANTGGTATLGGILGDVANVSVATWLQKIGTLANTGGTATLGGILGDPANTSLATRLVNLAAQLGTLTNTGGTATVGGILGDVNNVSVATSLAKLGTLVNTGGTATLGGVLGDVANVSVATWLQKIGTLTNTGGTATLGGIIGDVANVTVATSLAKLGAFVNTGGTATVGAILGDPANVAIATRLVTLQAELSGAAGIASWLAAAAPGDGVSLSEALRYIVETQIGTLTNTGGTATLGGIIGDVANVSVATWLGRIGAPANTGGTATLAAIVGDPANVSLASRMTTLQAELSGAAGIASWLAAAAPADGVSLSEGLRYIVETQLGTLTNTGGTATVGGILGDVANVSVAARLIAIAADTDKIDGATLDAAPVAGSIGRFLVSGGTAHGTPLPDSKSLYDMVRQYGDGYLTSKELTYDGNASYNIFTVTGGVAAKIVGYITTALTNHADTTSVGTATSVAGLIAATAGTAMQTANSWWVDNAPSKFESFPATWSLIGNGEEIAVASTANITGGVVTFLCYWKPMTTGSTVVAA